MAVRLPTNPDLERFRRDARRLQRQVRVGDPEATALVARHHPAGAPTHTDEFTLAAAQLVVARTRGFASWPQLRRYLDVAAPLRRDVAHLSVTTPADVVTDLACLRYSLDDDPSRWARAAELLAASPELVEADVSVAAAVGDVDALRRHLAADPAAVAREAGPFRWPPILYLVYSRLPQRDPVGSLSLLLDHGADPSTGYLWGGLPTPFTALTGCFGEGEQGPGRQPRHPAWEPLARELLDAGADPNDGQTLYNRMFDRDDSHLRLLLAHGLGRGDAGVWRRRLGDATESPAQMMDRQVRWAFDHGFDERLDLLTRHGFRADEPDRRPDGVHHVGSPGAVRELAAAGGDLDVLDHGRTALHHFAWIGDVPMVAALLEAGADPTLVDQTYGTTPLDWAEYARQPDTAALLQGVTTVAGDTH